MDYVFLVMTKRDGVLELFVLTNSVGEVCAVRRADTLADGWRYIDDLRRAGHLTVVRDCGREAVFTVARR